MWLRCQDGSLIQNEFKTIFGGYITAPMYSGGSFSHGELIQGVVGKLDFDREVEPHLLYVTDGDEELETKVMDYITDCIASGAEVCDLTDEEGIRNERKDTRRSGRSGMVYGEIASIDAIARQVGGCGEEEDVQEREEDEDDAYPLDRRGILRVPRKGHTLHPARRRA